MASLAPGVAGNRGSTLAGRSARPAIARFVAHPMGLIGLLITVGLLLMAIGAPVLAPYDPNHQIPGLELHPPSTAHPFGTDELGRDVLSRVIHGARTTLMVGVIAVSLGALVGITAGLIAGYVLGWVDDIVMRLCDTLLAFPAVLLAVASAAAFGPGPINAALAFAVVSVPQFARITRAGVLSAKEREYVIAARTLGVHDVEIVIRHILPNIMAPVFVQIALAAAYAVLLEAGLSFIGLGTQPPDPSWGSMLGVSRTYLRQAPWYGFFPGLTMALLLLGLNFLADAARDVLSVRRGSLDASRGG